MQPFSLLHKPTSADCNLRCDYCFYLEKRSLYPETKTHRITDGLAAHLGRYRFFVGCSLDGSPELHDRYRRTVAGKPKQRKKRKKRKNDMGYVDTNKLIDLVVAREPLDSKALLADVDRKAVIRAVEKSKTGLPQQLKVTNQPMEERELRKMSRVNRRLLDSVYSILYTDPEKALPTLRIMRDNYPNVPCLYNYLAIACHNAGQEKEDLDIIHETIEKFPDYIFAKTMLAEYHLGKGDHREVPKIFGGEFDLARLYPDIKVFHISEVRAFLSVTGTYFVRVNNMSRALFNYFSLSDLEPDHLGTKQLGDAIIHKELDKLYRKFSK